MIGIRPLSQHGCRGTLLLLWLDLGSTTLYVNILSLTSRTRPRGGCHSRPADHDMDQDRHDEWVFDRTQSNGSYPEAVPTHALPHREDRGDCPGDGELLLPRGYQVLPGSGGGGRSSPDVVRESAGVGGGVGGTKRRGMARAALLGVDASPDTPCAV